jgi:hypothetical protein
VGNDRLVQGSSPQTKALAGRYVTCTNCPAATILEANGEGELACKTEALHGGLACYIAEALRSKHYEFRLGVVSVAAT